VKAAIGQQREDIRVNCRPTLTKLLKLSHGKRAAVMVSIRDADNFGAWDGGEQRQMFLCRNAQADDSNSEWVGG
jgi:hypothetical protein